MKSRPIMLCLIRAGQTVWAADGRIQGAADLPMSEAGRSAIMAALDQAATAKPAVIHHPSDEAATQTAQLFAQRLKAKTKSLDDLHDPKFGVLEGLTEREFEERFPTRYKQWEDDPLSLTPPEGEDFIHAVQRMFSAISRVLNRSRSAETGLVLHDVGIGLVRCWLADCPLTGFRDMISNRPIVERYSLTTSLLATLEKVALTAHADA